MGILVRRRAREEEVELGRHRPGDDTATPEEVFPFSVTRAVSPSAPGVEPATPVASTGDDHNNWNGQLGFGRVGDGNVNPCHNTDEVRSDPHVL